MYEDTTPKFKDNQTKLKIFICSTPPIARRTQPAHKENTCRAEYYKIQSGLMPKTSYQKNIYHAINKYPSGFSFRKAQGTKKTIPIVKVD